MNGKIIKISSEFISALCKTTDDCLILSINGIPKDAKFIKAYFDNDLGMFNCLFEHESFEPTEIGNDFPSQKIFFTKYYT